MSTNEITKTAAELMELKRMSEELDAEIATLEDAIKKEMGNREQLIAGAFKVTWKPVTSSRFDAARFKKDHAELSEAYTKVTTARRFCIN